MSLQVLAKQLAAKGRHGDTMLVHMSRDEVKGLAALAKANGDTLTINPETGLPEAFKLGSVLKAAVPIAAGFALGPAGAGIFSSALGAGLAVGGAYGLATGSLEKGLMAGLGAYGGAALGGAGTGLSAFTGSAAPAAVGAGSAFTPTASQIVGSGSALGATAPAAGSVGLGTGYGAANTGLGGLSASASPIGISAGSGAGAGALGGAGTSTIGQTAMNFIRNNPGTAAATLGLPILSSFMPDQPKLPTQAQDPGMIRPYQFERTQRPEAYARKPMDSSEQLYFNDKFTPLPAYQAAAGGQVPDKLERMAPGGLSSIEGMRDGYGALQTSQGDIPQYASGGISTLGGYSDGGRLLKGPGDGVSDDIPATINGKQPARLADGEFVVPARIVSELGNGSTDAGAKRLYDMMDRVEKHRRKSVGKGKIAKDTKAYKALPA